MKKIALVFFLAFLFYNCNAQCDLVMTITQPIACTGPLYAEVDFNVVNATLPANITIDSLITLTYLGFPVTQIIGQGTYIVTMLDAGGCTDIDTLVIDAFVNSQSQTFGASCSTCANGAAIITPITGTPPFSYGWWPNTSDTTDYAKNLVPGNYTCTITDSGGCLGQISINVGSNDSCFLLGGKIFYDDNENGVYDNFDYGIPDLKIFVTNSTDTVFSFSDSSGNYLFFVDSGSYTIFPKIDSGFVLSTAPTYQISIQSPQQINGLDFGIKSDSVVFSNGVISISGGFPRCNSINRYFINFTNKGNRTCLGNITLKFPNLLQIINSSVSPSFISSDTIEWDNFELLINKKNTIVCDFLLPNAQGIFLDYKLLIEFADSTGNIIFSDSSSLNQITECSFDPNNKLVSPFDINYNSILTNDGFIEYTINFQNTGTDTAFNILIIDTISSLLNLSTLEFLHSSHSTFFYCKNQTLNFNFQNILLPDSNTNEPQSHGYVSYRLKPYPILVPPITILNKAYIYFDFNLPIETNETSTLVLPLTLVENSDVKGDITVYPNPSVNSLRITSNEIIVSLIVFGLDGKKIITLDNLDKTDFRLDISNLYSGFYLIRLKSDLYTYNLKFIKH